MTNETKKPHPHAELMMMYAHDASETDTPWDRWECRNPAHSTLRWYELGEHPAWEDRVEYRRKTIRIGDYDVPEPLRSFDGVKQYYRVDTGTDGYLYAIQCENDHLDTLWLERGLCHATREAAELHSKALLSFTEQK